MTDPEQATKYGVLAHDYSGGVRCPFCGESADAEHVDIGVGFQRVEPWRCWSCMAFETDSKADYERLVADGYIESVPKSSWLRQSEPDDVG